MAPYQINQQVITATRNPEVKFMHCLPAFHNEHTTVGREIEMAYGLKDWKLLKRFLNRPTLLFSMKQKTGCTPLKR